MGSIGKYGSSIVPRPSSRLLVTCSERNTSLNVPRRYIELHRGIVCVSKRCCSDMIFMCVLQLFDGQTGSFPRFEFT